MGASDEGADDGVGVAERDRLVDEVLGEVGGGRVGVVGGSSHGVLVELEGRDEPGEGAEGEGAGVERVEERRLVLLEVAVVGERESLEGGEQPGEVPDRAVRSCPRASSATSGFFFWGSMDEPVAYSSARRAKPNSAPVQSTISSPRRERWTMRERADEERLGDEVAVGDRVERVVEAGGEAEVGGDQVGVEGQAGPGQRARAER